MTLAAVLCCAMITALFTACDNNDNVAETETPTAPTAIEINLDSLIIKPYLGFGSSLADVEDYIAEAYAEYDEWGTDYLEPFDQEGGRTYKKEYFNGDFELDFFFANADGTDLKLVSFDFFFPIQLEPVIAELERNGFVNKGEVKFDDYNADICYLLLSADGSIEAQLSSWEKNGGSWALSFQLLDEDDLNHLVKQ